MWALFFGRLDVLFQLSESAGLNLREKCWLFFEFLWQESRELWVKSSASKLISLISSNKFNKSDINADINNVKPQDAIVRFFLIVIDLWPRKGRQSV